MPCKIQIAETYIQERFEIFMILGNFSEKHEFCRIIKKRQKEIFLTLKKARWSSTLAYTLTRIDSQAFFYINKGIIYLG